MLDNVLSLLAEENIEKMFAEYKLCSHFLQAKCLLRYTLLFCLFINQKIVIINFIVIGLNPPKSVYTDENQE